ncbi:MAG: HesA/MoeB/ThiF family protein [bacterium]|nr:HesA/MoeB/ThiF family protein [bacterium]
MTSPADERYRRQVQLPEVGEPGQARLRAASALVVGAGGLGCAVLPYLVAAGLREVVVCDGDVVEPSNLPRQVLFGDADVGRPKAAAAAARLSVLNRECRVVAVTSPLGAANVHALVEAADVVVDATDDFAARYLLHDTCFAARRPLVTAAVHHDEGQLAVFRFDHAAAGPCWRCLWPEPPQDDSGGSCRERGILGPVPGVLGALQADQVLRVLLEASPLAQGQLVHVDLAASGTWRTTWEAAPGCPLCGQSAERDAAVEDRGGGEANSDQTVDQAGEQAEEVLWGDLASPRSCIWIDARSDREQALDPAPAVLAGMPIVSWRTFGAAGPPTGLACVVFCAHGIRSLDLARHWRRNGLESVSSLHGGLAGLRAPADQRSPRTWE